MFHTQSTRGLLNIAKPVMKSMFLLTINDGCGNGDVKGLKFDHIDLDSGWLDFRREKTGCQRRVKLWDETTAAIKDCTNSVPMCTETSAKE